MASFTKFNQFVLDLAHGVHDLETDQLTVGLTTNANAPTATDGQLSDLTEISYTNCSSRNVTTSTSSQTAGTYKLVVADLVLTASGGTVGPLRFVFVYNNGAIADELVGFYDYGSEITLADGETLTIDFDGSNGLLQLA